MQYLGPIKEHSEFQRFNGATSHNANLLTNTPAKCFVSFNTSVKYKHRTMSPDEIDGTLNPPLGDTERTLLQNNYH